MKYDDVWKQYTKCLGFNIQQDLNDTVELNEKFFIGKQWDGVTSNGLPTPIFNFLKRVVLFKVASITSDNLKMNASPLRLESSNITDIINTEFAALFEQNKVVNLIRECVRNAAVDCDGCTYTYWDANIENGQAVKGAIVTEVIENTRIFFGNGNDRRVQKQPYIIIQRREMLDEVKDRAEENGISKDERDLITVDSDDKNQRPENMTDDKVTVLLKLYRNKKTGTIWGYECTKSGTVKKPWDMGIRLYPVTWLNWDYVQDNYHGQAMITGLIPNQIFINKMFALSMISIMTTAYPKIVYDKTRVKSWDNRVGSAIGVNGGDVNGVAKIIDPAAISPQVSQLIKLVIDETLESLGITQAALGAGTSYNTSAILLNQKASSTPDEITKQNLYQSIEDLGRIYIEFMAENYGVRKLVPDDAIEAASFAGKLTEFDFSKLKEANVTVQLDVGASSYWSEIQSMQALDNMLVQGKIEIVDYLERIPKGHIMKQQALIDKYKVQQASMAASAEAMAGGGASPIPPPNPTMANVQTANTTA